MSGVGLGAAEILAQHWMDEDQDCVKCRRHFVKIADHAAHQLDALKAAGYRIVAGDIVDRAEALAALSPALWTFQPWGEQNQNGDYAESILFDSDGETMVYGLGDEDGAFILGAQKVVLDLAADVAEEGR